MHGSRARACLTTNAKGVQAVAEACRPHRYPAGRDAGRMTHECAKRPASRCRPSATAHQRSRGISLCRQHPNTECAAGPACRLALAHMAAPLTSPVSRCRAAAGSRAARWCRLRRPPRARHAAGQRGPRVPASELPALLRIFRHDMCRCVHLLQLRPRQWRRIHAEQRASPRVVAMPLEPKAPPHPATTLRHKPRRHPQLNRLALSATHWWRRCQAGRDDAEARSRLGAALKRTRRAAGT